METGEALGDAPGEERDAEVGGDFEKELFGAVFFGGFDGEDGVARIDEQAEFVAFSRVRIRVIGVVGIEFGGRIHSNCAWPTVIDRAVSVP